MMKLSCVCLMVAVLINLSSLELRAQGDLNPTICGDTGNYTANSTFANNLNATLSALSFNTSQFGFYTASIGQPPRFRANAAALCRADLRVDQCRSCVENAARELVQICPNQTEAIRWYELCLLRYSDLPINGSTDNAGYILANTGNASNPVQFQQGRRALLDDLRRQAVNGSSLIKVGAGIRPLSDLNTLYALLQCIPTMSSEECNTCLNLAITVGLPSIARGARRLLPGCTLRYELYPFFNDTRLGELNVLVLQPGSPPSPSPTPESGKGPDFLSPHRCLNTGNYTANSTYSRNLNATLSALSTNGSQYGFYRAAVGQEGQDRAHAVALCRADSPMDECRSCVGNATIELLQLCPVQKEAIRWYDLCMLHYSDQPITRNQEDIQVELRVMNTAEVNDRVQFRQLLTELQGDLRLRAIDGNSLLKAAAGSRKMPDYRTLNALLQCIPELPREECDDCLFTAGQSLNVGSEWERVLRASCNIHYEFNSFYDETRLRELGVLLVEPQITSDSPTGGPPDDNPRRKKEDNTTKIVVPIVVSVILVVCAAIFLTVRMKNTTKKKSKAVPKLPGSTEDISSAESLQYDFEEIRAATDDFADANKLGQGGFGAVYWGKLSNGQEIAVKRLSVGSGQGDKEFQNEVLLVAKLQHRNLVRLLGFSPEGSERLLIYEFVSNSSLDRFIFDPTKRSHLNWERRKMIIGGIARGLLYLHEDSRLRIIHRDLKASNILLDEEMNPKIADFGMARLFGQNEIEGSTNRIVGTYGYMSPEYAIYGQFSIKSDVFSFGVLLLEVITGRRIISNSNGENVQDLLTFTWKHWSEGTIENVVDPVLSTGRDSIRDTLRYIEIGLSCVQENPNDRPTMGGVVLMLSSSTFTLPVPSQPAFVVLSRFGLRSSTFPELGSEVKENQPETSSSQNVMSITEPYCR